MPNLITALVVATLTLASGCVTEPFKGGREHDLELSRRRADSVAAYLRAQGVRSERIFERGYGSRP